MLSSQEMSWATRSANTEETYISTNLLLCTTCVRRHCRSWWIRIHEMMLDHWLKPCLFPFVLWSDRDSTDLLLWFRCSGFDRSSFVEISSSRREIAFKRRRERVFMAGQVRKDELLARATVIGRKEWYCRFCSEANVWTRSKCRRCKTDIPSVFQGKHMQAVSSKICCIWSASSSGDGEDQMLVYKAPCKGNKVA